jgi:hypothetical protein
VHAAFVQCCHGVDEVSKGATKPVKSPDNERISWPGEGERLSKSRSVSQASRGGVGEDFFAASLGQRVLLERKSLVNR